MKFLAFLLLWNGIPLLAQVPGRVVAAGYRLPEPVEVAPGQIITLFVRRDASDAFPAATASEHPLPLRLNGYAVSLVQSDRPDPVPVPLQAVYPVENCYGVMTQICTPLTAITVQIPWELVPNVGRRPESFAALTVSRGGVAAEPVPLSPQADQIHVLTSCDSTFPPGDGFFPDEPGPCRSLVTHLDGSLVTPAAPAKAGESVVALVYGLGRTEDRIPTGDVPSSPIPIPGISLGFHFGTNLDGTRPQSPQQPEVVTLSRERAGLYRVSFVVPAPPEGTPSCTATSVVSNLTVTILRNASFDGAGICVER